MSSSIALQEQKVDQKPTTPPKKGLEKTILSLPLSLTIVEIDRQARHGLGIFHKARHGPRQEFHECEEQVQSRRQGQREDDRRRRAGD